MKYLIVFLSFTCCFGQNDSLYFEQALNNGRQANEAFRRSNMYLHGWLAKRDPVSGLIPRNLNEGKDQWNAQDAAADNYPFMVLTASFTDRKTFETTMPEMLRSEERLTSRIGKCPATYSFSKRGFSDKVADTGNVIFGSAEYMKDGLLPLTEWLGPSPWCDRMIGILGDLHKITGLVRSIKGNYLGGVPAFEANGDLLQVLSRMYWMTENDEYLRWAEEIGDYYLLGENHPTNNSDYLRLRDHGCEMVLGLCELYAMTHYVDPLKAEKYREPVIQMLDCILEKGRNKDGFFYNTINPKSGQILDSALADTWGYILDGYYIMYTIENKRQYNEAVLKLMGNLPKYRNYLWEGSSSDGYADAIESAINLYNREPVSVVPAWIDSEIKVMWAKQQPDGIIEGWHGDGNFARTSVLYALWKTQGVRVADWRSDVTLGCVRKDKKLYISLYAKDAWSSTLIFDKPRHEENLHLPFDYTRINQFPEWTTIYEKMFYALKDNGREVTFSGKELIDGIPVALKAGEEKRMVLLIP